MDDSGRKVSHPAIAHDLPAVPERGMEYFPAMLIGGETGEDYLPASTW